MARQRRSASPETVGIRNMMGGAAVKSDLPPIPSKISTAYGSPVEAAPKPTRRRAGASIKEVVNDIIVDARSDQTLTGNLSYDLNSPADSSPQSGPSIFMVTKAGSTPAPKKTPKPKSTPASKGKGKGKGKGKKPNMTTSQGGQSPDPISEPNVETPTTGRPPRGTSIIQTPLAPIDEEDADEAPSQPLAPPDDDDDEDFFLNPDPPNSDRDGQEPTKTPSPSPSPTGSGSRNGSGSPKHPREESDEEEASQSPPTKKTRTNHSPFDKSVAHVRHNPEKMPPRASTRVHPPVPSVGGGLFSLLANDSASDADGRTFGDAESILGDMETRRTPPPATPAAQNNDSPFQGLGSAEHTPPPPDARSVLVDPWDGSYTYSHAPPSIIDSIALNPHRSQRRIRYPLPGAPNMTPGGTRYYTLPAKNKGQQPPIQNPPQPPVTNTTPVPLSNQSIDDVDMPSPTPGPRDNIRKPPRTFGILGDPNGRPGSRDRSRSASPRRSPTAEGPSNGGRSRSPVGGGHNGNRPNSSSSNRPGSRQGGHPGSSSGTQPGSRPVGQPAPQPAGYPSLPPVVSNPPVTAAGAGFPDTGLGGSVTGPPSEPGPQAPPSTGSQLQNTGSQGIPPQQPPVQAPLPPQVPPQVSPKPPGQTPIQTISVKPAPSRPVQAPTNTTTSIRPPLPPPIPAPARPILTGPATQPSDFKKGQGTRGLFTTLSNNNAQSQQTQGAPNKPAFTGFFPVNTQAPTGSQTGQPANGAQPSNKPPTVSAPVSQLPSNQSSPAGPAWWQCLMNTWPFRRHDAPSTPARPGHRGGRTDPLLLPAIDKNNVSITTAWGPRSEPTRTTSSGNKGGVRTALPNSANPATPGGSRVNVPTQAYEDMGFLEWLWEDTHRTLLCFWTWLSNLFGSIWATIVFVVGGILEGIRDTLFAVHAWIAGIIYASYSWIRDTGAGAFASACNMFRATERSTSNPPVQRPVVRPVTTINTNFGTASSTHVANASKIDWANWFRALSVVLTVSGLVYGATCLFSQDRSAQSIEDEIFPPSNSNPQSASYSPSHSEVSMTRPIMALAGFLSSILSGMWSGIAGVAHSAKQSIPSMPSLHRPQTWSSPADPAEFDAKIQELGRTVSNLVSQHEVRDNTMDKLRQVIPSVIHMDTDANGNLQVAEPFWHALKDLMKTDEEVLTLHKDGSGSYQVSDQHFDAFKVKYAEMSSQPETPSKSGAVSDGTQATSSLVARLIDERLPASWIEWVSQNHERVHQALDQAGVTSSITEDVLQRMDAKPGNLVTRVQFLSDLEKEFGKNRVHIMNEVDGYMKRTGDKLVRSLVDEALQARGVDDLSNRRILALVEEKVRHILGSAGAQGLSKAKLASIIDEEVGRGVNFFGLGTGAFINIKGTSPNYMPRPKSFLSQQWRRAWQPSPPEPYRALGPWEDFGDCWCGSKVVTHEGESIGVSLSVNLGHTIAPTLFIMEHIPAARSLEPEAVPNEVELWAFVEDRRILKKVKEMSRRFFYDSTSAADSKVASGSSVYGAKWVRIGQFNYRAEEGRDGSFVYRIPAVLLEAGLQTDHVAVRAVNNVGGADHTCIYRVKLYGQKVDSHRPMKKDEQWH